MTYVETNFNLDQVKEDQPKLGQINEHSESSSSPPSFLKDSSIGGVDWKSLTIPASLPITTDYFPGLKSLEDDFLFAEYFLKPEDLMPDKEPLATTPLTLQQLFRELVSQRLVQGFQLIVKSQEDTSKSGRRSLIDFSTAATQNNEVWLSIGRLYHRIR